MATVDIPANATYCDIRGFNADLNVGIGLSKIIYDIPTLEYFVDRVKHIIPINQDKPRVTLHSFNGVVINE